MLKITNNIKNEIERYMRVGLSLESAAKKVKSNHLGRVDFIVDSAVKLISRSK